MATRRVLVAIVQNGMVTLTTMPEGSDRPNMAGDYGPKDIFTVASSTDSAELSREAKRFGRIVTRKIGEMKTFDLREVVQAAIMEIQKLRSRTQIDHLLVTPSD